MKPSWFLEGVNENLAFTYAFGENDDYEQIKIRLVEGETICGETAALHRPGRCGTLSMNWTPPRAGRFALGVELVCRRDDETEDDVLRAGFEVEVKPRSQNVNVNVGSINVSDIYGSDLTNTHIASVNLPPEKLDDQRETRALKLAWARTPSRLLLVAGDDVVQLVARKQATFGRARGNDGVLRVFDERGTVRTETSKRLSGTHFRLAFDQGACLLLDGAEGRASTNGTFLDGEALPPGGYTELQPGLFEVGFGPATDSLKVQVQVCGNAFGRIQGCVLARTDGARRRTVLLRSGEIPFGDAGERVAWADGLFTVVTAAGERILLVPGAEVAADGKVWRVEPFGPTWVHGPGRS